MIRTAGKSHVRKKRGANPPVDPTVIAHSRALSASNRYLRQRTRKFQTIARELTHLLSSTDIAMLFVDKEFRIRSFTPSMRDLLNVSQEDLGLSIRNLERHFDDTALLSDMQVALLMRETREAEVESKSGRVYVRLALPYRTDNERVDGVVLTFIDITRRKLAETALRTSEERHRMILESVAEYAILLLDTEGHFVNWTSSAMRIYGYTPPEAVGQHLEMLHPKEERKREVVEQEMKVAREQRSITVERWHIRKDGSRFWGTGVLSALYDESDRLYGYVKVLRDNTDRKLAIEALRQAKIDAELANSAKDFFLANVSHELRTPLSVMLLWAKMLRRQRKIKPQQLREGLNAIVKSAEEQQALIEDLMDTSRIVAGKMRLEMEEVKLVPLAAKALDVVRPSAVEKELRLEYRIDPKAGTVHADALRLQQVLVNLLNNAVKFTPEGGLISLNLHRSGDDIEIRVSDTGQGISPEFIGRVFDRFTQADANTDRVNGGLGLGLSIVRQLVQLHGGTIDVHSDGLNKGTTFTVHLPLPVIKGRKSSPKKEVERLPTLRGLTILLVEDAPQTRRALSAALREAKATVIAVDSAHEALRRFAESRPDLLLSDIGLGKVSGYELLAEIRKQEQAHNHPPVPAVALTAYADERNRELATQSGFQVVLKKPVTPAGLVTTLKQLAPSA